MRNPSPRLSAVVWLSLIVALASFSKTQTASATQDTRQGAPVNKRVSPKPDPAGIKQLDAYVEQLQKTPDDQGLRETIIKLVLTMKPAPAIPEEARRHFVTAVGMMNAATTPAAAELATKEYQQALLLAPWWGEAYLKSSEAWQLLKRYPEAIQALKYYVLTGPQNAREAQDRVYALEGEQKVAEQEAAAELEQQKAAAKAARERAAERERQEAAAKERERQELAAQEAERRRDEEARRNQEQRKKEVELDGGLWKQTTAYAHNYRNGSDWGTTRVSAFLIEILGGVMKGYRVSGELDGLCCFTVNFAGRRDFEFNQEAFGGRVKTKFHISISEDGQSIVVEQWDLPQPSMYEKWLYERVR